MSLSRYLQTTFNSTVRSLSAFFIGNSQRRRYDPRQHVNFYVVAGAIVQYLLDSPKSDKTARQFAEATGYAESTIRAVCKILVADGTFVLIQEFPASYALKSEQAGRESLVGFKLVSGL